MQMTIAKYRPQQINTGYIFQVFQAQGREDDWMELKPDADAIYD